ncbi:MAG: acetate--CoA ligase family protein [Spirochaetes bacterium]|nr:acetate--CoA ligase family protein [Spirochaetota bacterium]
MHDRRSLDSIFYPESIAVIGANKVPGTVPHDILVNILKSNFQGIVYPVSPKEKAIAGVKTYKYIVDIPDPVDLAVIVFPSSVTHMALEQCGEKGIQSVIIISAGFKEVGEAGIRREEQIKQIAKKYKISFIGPNCLGVINTDPLSNLNASFAREMPEEGSIGFISQSGALCTAVLDYAIPKHIGFSKFVSFGNKADITEIDLLYYFMEDDKTKVILVYLEEITDGRALMKAARDIISKSSKPILLLKSGRTSEGARAAASHTGSLAGSDVVCGAAMRQAGIIRCNTFEEMFNKAIALTYQPLPKNNRVAIITNAGGPGVLATDAAIKEGVQLAQFSEQTTELFRKSLPSTANIKNPVDVIGDARADRYNVALSGVLKDHNVDGALVILTPQSMTQIDRIAEEISLIASTNDKPVYASFMGEAEVASGINILQKRHIPHYTLPEFMSSAFAGSFRFYEQLKQSYVKPGIFRDVNKKEAGLILNNAIKNKRKYLPEEEAVRVLKAYGLPVPENGLAVSSSDAIRIAEKIGFPIVMKVVSDQIIHKSDPGGVRLNIKNRKEVEKAYQTIIRNVSKAVPDAEIKGIYIAKMAQKGEEVILGIKRDPSFGPVIMFGLGGIFVEVFRDISFRVAPLNNEEASSMIREIQAYPLLSGIRGKIKKDTGSIEECLLRLSQLAMDCPQIKELDINPLIVQEDKEGCTVADARIML